MNNSFNFICLSCHEPQPETPISPYTARTISAAICTNCGQVIAKETRQAQLDAHLYSQQQRRRQLWLC